MGSKRDEVSEGGRTWAAEHGSQGVRVNTVTPGPTPTAAVADIIENFDTQTPLGRTQAVSPPLVPSMT